LTKSECIQSLKDQGYTLKALDKDETKVLRNWKDDPTSDDIIENNYGVILNQDEQFVIDIDDPEFNEVLQEYLDKTLVNQTGRNGRHYYFKDNVPRLEQYRIKTTKLYYNGKIIGDIKAKFGYVIGCGSIHANGNEYKRISPTNKILELDGYEILKILIDYGITTRNETIKKTKFEDGLQEGERNNECFKTACDVFEKRHLDYESGLNFIKTWNSLSKKPLDKSEINAIVKSAWDRIKNKDLEFDGADKINNVVKELQEKHTFVTLRKTNEILLFNGKIYDKTQAETIIKEETEKLIPNCTTHHRNEVVNKIKVQTYSDIENFDSDPNIVVIENGILSLDTLELTPHTPDHLSRVLLPVQYIAPEFEINDNSIFEDIEKNLQDTLFWKSLKNSFVVDGKFKKNGFETAIEVSASPIIKHHIDEKAIMFLGNGDNGKSVLLEYIESLYGEDNISNITLQNIADDKFMSADLDGMSANIFTDLGHNELRNTGKIKAIVSNEGIQVQRKHQQGFKLKPYCKLIFSCNRFPKVFDQSQGFFRRWIIVKWERNFDGDPQRDEGLKQKLTTNQEEKNLVFSCLVRLANRLNKVGKFTHTIDWKTIQREWNENADPLDGFATNYIIDSENSKTKRETYQFYKEIMFEKGETPLGIGQFSKAFAEYYEEDRDSNTRIWLNIDFKRPIQTKMKESESDE
jgi:P4 family phage/plasmid primase-like protien